MERRAFLRAVVAGIGAGVAAALAVLAGVVALAPAFPPRKPLWRALEALEDFPLTATRLATFDVPPDGWRAGPAHRAVYVWRQGPDEIVVFSRACTDLGCPVTWDPGSEVFFCPCHGGMFGRDGGRLAGPPNRPLYRYATRVRDGRLEIDTHSVLPIA